jgi:16S rRNA (adenine1518-N6/adenine1519-N6)-dimethyltransferase
LEIGPGLGPLTALLMERAEVVCAIEKDQRLVEVLRERFRVSGSARDFVEAPGLHLIHDDALDYLKGKSRDWSEWKLVSNLPYSVASPILVELAQGSRSPGMIVATLQLEVAKRLMSRADDADYGILTLLVQVDFEPRNSFKIPSACFFPEPDVDSACVVLRRRMRPLVPDAERATFVRVVKRAFSQRRKMMMKLLKQDWAAEKLAMVFKALAIPAQIRAEAVTLEQFARMTSLLHPRQPKSHE